MVNALSSYERECKFDSYYRYIVISYVEITTMYIVARKKIIIPKSLILAISLSKKEERLRR